MNNSIIPQSENQTGLVVYQFEGQNPIRVVSDDNGDPWFVAADVCEALGLEGVSKALARLDPDEKRQRRCSDVNNSYHELWIVNESGLYSLILTSRKPEARRFKKWITSEVLPAIRKNGQYSVQTLSPLDQLKLTVAALEDQQKKLAQLSARVERIEDTYEAEQGQPQMMTIVGYVTFRKLRLSSVEIAAKGKAATRYSQQHGYPIEQIGHKVWGHVNAYHIDVLREIFKQRSMFEGGK